MVLEITWFFLPGLQGNSFRLALEVWKIAFVKLKGIKPRILEMHMDCRSKVRNIIWGNSWDRWQMMPQKFLISGGPKLFVYDRRSCNFKSCSHATCKSKNLEQLCDS